jgi:hypothetical protein
MMIHGGPLPAITGNSMFWEEAHNMSSEAPVTTRRLRRYSWLIVLLAIVAMAPIGWSIFWYAKSREAAAALTAWMAQEARKGRIWSCPSQKIVGFPYATTISCENIEFRGEAFGRTVTGTLHGLRATSPLTRNDNVLVKLDPPFTVKSSSGDLDMTAQWRELLVQIDGAPGRIGQLAFLGSQVRLQGVALGADAAGCTASDVTGSFAKSPGRQDEAYDVTVSLHQGVIPALNNLLDTNVPVALQFEATMTPGIPSAATLAETLEKWRGANGKLDVTFASLTGGPVDFHARGGLGIDDEHRLAGKLDASFAGLDRALRNLNIDPTLFTVGQALSGLLRGGKDGERLKLPVIFSGGSLRIGPIRTGIQIPPLY